MQTGIFKRYKSNVPFSETLNAEIDRLTSQIMADGYIMELVDHDPFNDDADPADYFQYMLKLFREEKRIQIWTGGTDNNIYGSAEMNYLFRFWHDYVHLAYNLGFDPMDEIKVSQIQQAQAIGCTNDDLLLINADITGQVIYFAMFGEFPVNQRKFVIEYLETGVCSKQRGLSN